MRPIPALAVDFVARHEGRRLAAYRDQAGVWTIGYGHTGGVSPGDRLTAAQAREFLRKDLETAGARLARKIGAVADDLTEPQYAALLSFVFNLGTGDPARREWTIWGRLRARRFDQVPLEMMRFVNAGGRKLQGLVNRRSAEVKLWSSQEPGSVAGSLPSSVTREIATPPTPADPTPAAKSPTLITLAAGAAASVPVAAERPKVVAAQAQARVSGLETLGARESAARVAATTGLRDSAAAAVADLTPAALTSEDAHVPLDPARAARLRAHDRRLCELAPDLAGCPPG